MLKFIYSMFWSEVETNSLCPNSFGPMPSGKFHNFAIEIMPHDDDDEDCVSERRGNTIIDTKITNKKINITTFVDETSNEYDSNCDV
jgi:hypothetical protein